MNWQSTAFYSFSITNRGYTGHEHLLQFGLINMNGRMYDPLLARMLSPDPFIPNPALSQDYNRYSYVRNNPLKYTDPSGYNYTYWNYSTGTYMSSGGAYVDSWGAWNEWFSGLEGYRDGFYTTGGQVLGTGSTYGGLFSDNFYASSYGLEWYNQHTGRDLVRHNGQWGFWDTKTVYSGYSSVRDLPSLHRYNVSVFNSVNGGGDPPKRSVWAESGSFYASAYSITAGGFHAAMRGRDPFNPTQADEDAAGDALMNAILFFAGGYVWSKAIAYSLKYIRAGKAINTVFKITNQSINKTNIQCIKGSASEFYKLLNPNWNGIMPKTGYESFKTLNGTKVLLYPAEISNQGLATIKIISPEGYKLIFRFNSF